MFTTLLNIRKVKFAAFLLDCAIAFTVLHLFVLHTSLFAFFLFGFLMPGLYSFRCYDFTDHNSAYSMVVACISAITLAAFASFFFTQFFHGIIGRKDFTAICLILLPVISALHAGGYIAILRLLPKEHIVVLGDASWEHIFREIYLATQGKIVPTAYALPSTTEIWRTLRAHPAASSLIITNPQYMGNPKLSTLVNDLMKKDFRVKYLSEAAETTLQRIPLPLLEAFREYYDIGLRTQSPRAYSRAFDIVVSILLMLFLSPVFFLTACSIALIMGSPLLFSQPRIGRNGKPFLIHKFRTMTTSDDESPSFASENAHRITSLGNFLRKTRLDELPQLWNVLKGEMSLIGPRPEQVEFDRQYEQEIPFYVMRQRLRPGITGWAQINYAYASNRKETSRKLEYDLYYVKNASPLLDLEIILKTIQTTLGMRGSK